MSTAAVVGGTGLVGSHLARLLAGDSGYERVLSLTRRATGLTLPGLDERVIDFERLAGDPETFDPIECDSAFCTLGTTIKVAGSEDAFRRVDLDYVEAFARAARAGGARRFLMVSSIGADAASRNFYLSVKGRAEDAVRAAGFESVGVFRPGVLLGERAEKRPAEQWAVALMGLIGPLLRGPLARYRGAPAAMVARAMLAASHAPSTGASVFTFNEMRTLASSVDPGSADPGSADPG